MTRRLVFALVALTACSFSTLLLLSTSFSTHADGGWGEVEGDHYYYADAPQPHHDEGAGNDHSAGSDTAEEGEARGGEDTAIKGGRLDGDDDHPNRPKKRPKGEKWRGWDGHSDGGSPPPKDEWWRNSNNCFAVDDICRRGKDNEWFYYDGRNVSTTFQPNMELKCAPAKYDGGANVGERRISIKVSSSSKMEPAKRSFEEDGMAFVTIDSNETRCRISPSRVHVVVQSTFNDMIGEFYSRSLLGLYGIMKEGVNRTNGSTLPWEEGIQFYAHIAYGNKIMLDGHKLLLGGMLSNPDSPPPKSFLDLFVQNEGEHNIDECECYEKMVFCGYDVYTHDNDALSKDLELAVDVDDGDEINASINRALTYDHTTKFTLWSSSSIDGGVDMANCGRSSILDDEYACLEWNGLRKHIGANFLRHYPTLAGDIADKRREYLLKTNFIDNGYIGNTEEFTVVGLTQRTYRRSWINLPDILEKCNAAAFERVICVEVNVEKMSSPFEQLILHRSLDVIIGVHGAQLTQGVLLPPDAHVLELLPWITDYIRGDWVRTTHIVTPLGVIFHNTDLNHLGYSLDRSSVPMCEGVPRDEEEGCFLGRRKEFIWDNRDFIVESDIILRYIEKFVLFVRERKERTCDELKYSLDKRFVMYNTWCVKPPENTTLSLWHNYHPRKWRRGKHVDVTER